MKNLKLTVAIIAIAFLESIYVNGQVLHADVVVKYDEYDFTQLASFLGIVTGTYTYSYSVKLNKEGTIENIHWVIKDCNLQNQYGDKIILHDTGHDALGDWWSFWSWPNAGNGYDPGITYDVQEGWLDAYIPESLPVEGTMVGLSFKMMVNGQKWTYWAGMAQLHINANGVITANVVKP